MCGIAGIIGERPHKYKAIQEMTSVMQHRGPDDDGFFSDDKVALGMRRLAIIDLVHGEQPIWSADGRKCIFFNGEIYNYKELRAELEAQGKKFKTSSDTEVILEMYAAHGKEMLPRLRGMFAFCIYDKESGNLFLARDFFGIKPLYYLKDGEKIAAFASEIKSFLSFPGFKVEVNDAAAYNYLSFQYNPLNETFFKNVYKLPPGNSMLVDASSGLAEIEPFWTFQFSEKMKGYENKLAEETRQIMRDSVSHHMIADVPVGSLLSGGVDSSIIATLMQEVRGDKKIKTFTVGFEGLTEGKEAAQTSDYLGTDHTEITVGPEEYFGVLPKLAWHFDEPVADPSAVGLYFIAREARKSVKVILSGEGADELFGGYNIYLEPFARKRIAWLPQWILKIGAALASLLPEGLWGRNYVLKAREKLQDWYIGNASIFKPEEIKKLWSGEQESLASLKPLYENVAKESEPTQMQYIDIQTWLVGDILAKADKMTMANSLELRVPFLDKEVADFARTLPDDLKWRGGVTKYLLRKAFMKVIPESTRLRRKLGFPTPIREWLKKESSVYESILNNGYLKSHLNQEEIKKIISEHRSGAADNSRKIYLLLMLALWYNAFVLKQNYSNQNSER
jgi:asparagine synthase (glutamine-hydrolysing)